ncbi:MAG: uroporphyrinogen decarboxylase family protein [Thermoguttaceae bacterium]|nr:uroporphyrinogen decarboxylase family protein [Thermoguttaceae bacterium]MDW8079644.1 uroporphyrinogen decarboxylase family protein [Thermoguttaceae bacterium]
MNGYERMKAMLEGRPVDRLPFTPITMMFAADQRGIPYGEYATDYRKLVDAQLYTAEKFGFDSVMSISDPAREAADLGAAVCFFPNQPPALDESHSLLLDKKKLLELKVPDPWSGRRMRDRLEAIRLFREKVGGQLFVEGWVEGPMAESADLRGINRIMTDLYDDPAFVRDLFEFVVEMETRFAYAQIEAGANLIGIGDSAASLIGPRFYREFVVPYEKRLIDNIHQKGAWVRLHICGRTGPILADMGQVGADIIDLDFPASMAEARQKMGPRQILCGNIDPVRVLRDGTPEQIKAELEHCYQAAAPHYIVAAGCEVPRDTPEANMKAMLEFARTHRPYE